MKSSKVIYGLIDSDTRELRYIGQTTQLLNARLSSHKSGGGPNIHLNNWVRAHHVSIIVLERDPDDINEAERYWIKVCQERNARLLNLTDGGDGGGMAGRSHSAESRAKMSTSRIGKPPTRGCTGMKFPGKGAGNTNAAGAHWSHTPVARAKISAANTGRLVSAATRARISAAKRGVGFVDEVQ